MNKDRFETSNCNLFKIYPNTFHEELSENIQVPGIPGEVHTCEEIWYRLL